MTEPFIEVRIHGVSGTSATELLQARPVRADNDPETDLTKPANTSTWTRAFRWSSLTSGRPTSALWILLLPYMLANAVGWALPPRASAVRHRIDVALTRIVGGFLTMIFSLVTAYGFIVVGGYSAFGVGGDRDVAIFVPLGALVSLASIWLVWWLTRSRDRELEPVLHDPSIPESSADWDLMRRAHLGIGAGSTLWILGVVAREAFIESSDIAGRWIAFGIGTALAALVLLGISAFWSGNAFSVTTGAAALVSGMGVVWFGIVIWLGSTDVARPESLTTTGEPLAMTVIWFTVAALLLVAIAWSREHQLATPAVATLLSIAGASGAAVGAAVIQVTTTPTGTQAPRSIGVIAEGFLLGVLLLIVVIMVLLFLSYRRVEPGDNRGWRAFVAIIDAPKVLLYSIPAVITAVSVAVFVTIDTRPELNVFEIGARVTIPLILATVVYLLRAKRPWAIGIALIGAIGYFGFDRLGGDFQSLAVAGTLILPAGLVGSRIVSGYRDVDTRRGLAIAWDVGSYFPSLFHPFAPPPYGATAVASLRSALEEMTKDGRPVVVTAHSQGSVVAAQAVSRNGFPAALCTVGSPLGTLYRPFFPAHFNNERYADINSTLAGWSNLFRNDDPVGGPILPDVDEDEMDDPRGRIHAAYWFRDEPVYNKTMGELLRKLDVSESDIPDRYR